MRTCPFIYSRTCELSTHGEIKGDVTTLEDFTVIAKLRESDEG